MNMVKNDLGAVPLDMDSGFYTSKFIKWARSITQPGFKYHVGVSENGESTVIYRETGGKLGFWARVPNGLKMFDVEYV